MPPGPTAAMEAWMNAWGTPAASGPPAPVPGPAPPSTLGAAWDWTKDKAAAAGQAVGAFDASHGHVLTRAAGVAQAVGGVGEAVAGSALAGVGGAATATGVGAAPGVPAMIGGGLLAASGVDNAVAGARTALSGEPHHTLTAQAAGGIARGAGASNETAERITGGVDLAQGLVGGGGAIAAGVVRKGALRTAELAAETRAAKIATAKVELGPLLKEAEAGKAMIDPVAEQTAAKFGGVVSKAPVKSLDRAAEKVVTEYRGNPRLIKDLARNTVVVQPSKVQAAVDDIVTRMKVPPNRIKVADAGTDPLGYSGRIIGVEQPNGMLAEIQVNSPEMIFAKENEAYAMQTLGPELFNTIKEATGLPGGRGHALYEAYRILPKGSPEAMKIAAESKAYYAAIRAGAKRIDWTKAFK